MLVIKELRNCLFLPTMVVRIELQLIHTRYFLPRMKIENYNIEIGGRNFYDEPINDLFKQDDEVRKVLIGQGDDYTTGWLLDFAYFEKKKD